LYIYRRFTLPWSTAGLLSRRGQSRPSSSALTVNTVIQDSVFISVFCSSVRLFLRSSGSAIACGVVVNDVVGCIDMDDFVL